MHDAVNAVADDQPVLERFDMDVRSAGVERLADHQADQADYRCFACLVFQMLNVGLVEVVDVHRLDVLDDLAHGRAAAAEQAFEGGLKVIATGHAYPYRPFRQDVKGLDRIGIGGIHHGYGDGVPILGDGQSRGLAQKADSHAFFKHGKLGVGRSGH